MATKMAKAATPTYQASHRHARISARKARLVMDLIRGESVETALVRLLHSGKRASPMIRKVVQSAVANAAQASGVEPEKLVVHKAYVDDGPTMKRWKPRSMGRAFPRLRRSCHISVIVSETSDSSKSDSSKSDSSKSDAAPKSAVARGEEAVKPAEAEVEAEVTEETEVAAETEVESETDSKSAGENDADDDSDENKA
jgi:large subunit ribosomal protein L22